MIEHGVRMEWVDHLNSLGSQTPELYTACTGNTAATVLYSGLRGSVEDCKLDYQIAVVY